MPDISALCPHLAPRPSRALRWFVAGAHLLALPAAWLNPLPTVLRLGLTLGLAWSFWHSSKRIARPAVVGLRLLPDGGWRLNLPGGARTDARLLGSSIATPWFVLLHLDAGRAGRFNLLLCRDSLETDAFRRLRVALRAGGLDEDRLGD